MDWIDHEYCAAGMDAGAPLHGTVNESPVVLNMLFAADCVGNVPKLAA